MPLETFQNIQLKGLPKPRISIPKTNFFNDVDIKMQAVSHNQKH